MITTTGGALPEAAGDAALLVAPGSAAELASAMERLAGDAGMRTLLVHRGQARVMEHSWLRTAEQTLEVYEKAGSRR